MNTCTPWTTAETKTLRRVYPIGGSVACAPLIPRHGVQAISRMASVLGLRAPAPGGIQQAAPVPESAMATILEAVRHGLRGGDYVRLAEATGLPPWTVKKLAHRLAKKHGLAAPYCGQRRWSDAELLLLKSCLHMRIDEIVRTLADAGYQRSRTAVRNRLNILSLTRDDDHMTANELARRLGFDLGIIRRDIRDGRLHAIHRPGVLRPDQRRGPKRWWWIAERSVQTWLRANGHRLERAQRNAPTEWRLWLSDLLGDMMTVEEAKVATNGLAPGGVPAHWMEAA